MAKLIYSAIASLDGYVADEDGNFEWAAPDEAVHAFVNELERPVGTYLYGRRMYETMVYWETAPAGQSVHNDFTAIWQAAEKIVYSTTLPSISSRRTRIVRAFDPAAVKRMKDEATRDLSIGGPTLAASAITAGLVDEFQVLVVPVIIGGGLAAWPGGVRAALELTDERRFPNGMVFLRYASKA